MKIKLRAQSLRARLMLSIGSSLLLGLALLCGFVNWEASKIVEQQTVGRAQVEADAIGAHIAQSFNLLAHGVDQLAADILTAKRLGRENRAHVVEQLRELSERMPAALGYWVCMEPNAFGGSDADAKNTEGSNALGLFAPYWTRASGRLSLETSDDYSEKDYYRQPRTKKAPLFLDPYLDTAGGQSVLMTSYTVPLYEGDRFIGVVGVDLSLNSLDKLTMGNAFVQQLGGYAAVISSGGITAAHPSKDYLGKSFASMSTWAQAFEADMKEGKAWMLLNTSSSKKEKVYRIGVPMQLGAKINPWTVVVTLPQSAMLTAVKDMRNLIILLGCAGFVLVLGLIISVTHRITKPIGHLSQGLLDGAAQISSAAAQVSNSGQILAQTASQQAAALEESSASLEELSSMTKSNTQNAGQATQLAREAREATDHGLEQMKSMQAAMGAIKSSSDEIAKIIKTIDEIAFQTNILALNAAVEAARAGEAGAGFAVVAEEVRNLAQRSAHAARETSEKIEGAISKTQQGVRMSEEVATSLSSIATRIHSVDDLVAQVAGAAGEQTRGIGQINSAVTDLDRITQTNAATAEESASAAQELNAQADVFRKLIGDLDRVIRG